MAEPKKVYNKELEWDKEGIHAQDGMAAEVGDWLHMWGLTSQKPKNVPLCLLEICTYKTIKEIRD